MLLVYLYLFYIYLSSVYLVNSLFTYCVDGTLCVCSLNGSVKCISYVTKPPDEPHKVSWLSIYCRSLALVPVRLLLTLL